jgi:hypothetical protein
MGQLRRWWAQYRQATEDARYARGGLVDMGAPPPEPSNTDPDALFEDYDG